MKLPLARRCRRMRRSTIREILKLMARKGIISFAGGLPAPDLFPIEHFTTAMQDALTQDGPSALQYDVTEGYAPLKEFLCAWLGQRGIRCGPENLMLTNGSQQALDLVGKIFINPNDKILVEDPTYLGAIQAFDPYEARYVSTPLEPEGPRIADFKRNLERHSIKFAYFVPTFQNPSGITMTLERRRTVLRLLKAKSLWAIEDDPYGFLRFSGTAVPSLYQLANGRGVVYMSTFSKILSPGIRLGFVVAQPDLIQSLVLAKQAADLQPNTLIQRAVYHYCRRGYLDEHIPKIIEAYGNRAEWMMQAMKREFPKSVQWIRPEGGMFIWVKLGEGLSATRIFKKAVDKNVAFVTGTVFHPNGGGDDTLRLNFTNSNQQQIDEGIRRLGEVLNESKA
jgi:2-aminoadipate transaminase